jgi:hypothetical protein
MHLHACEEPLLMSYDCCFCVLFNPHGFEPTRCPRDALTGPASCEPFPRSPPFSSLKHGILKWHQIFSTRYPIILL